MEVLLLDPTMTESQHYIRTRFQIPRHSVYIGVKRKKGVSRRFRVQALGFRGLILVWGPTTLDPVSRMQKYVEEGLHFWIQTIYIYTIPYIYIYLLQHVYGCIYKHIYILIFIFLLYYNNKQCSQFHVPYMGSSVRNAGNHSRRRFYYCGANN